MYIRIYNKEEQYILYMRRWNKRLLSFFTYYVQKITEKTEIQSTIKIVANSVILNKIDQKQPRWRYVRNEKKRCEGPN